MNPNSPQYLAPTPFQVPAIADPCSELIPLYLQSTGSMSPRGVFNVPATRGYSLFPCSQEPIWSTSLYNDERMTSAPSNIAVGLMNRSYAPKCSTTYCLSARDQSIRLPVTNL